MNFQSKPKPTLTAIKGGFVADASQVSPAQFFDAVFGSRRDAYLEQLRERCTRAILRGDIYGYPPVLVEQCRAAIKPVCETCGHDLPEHDECYSCSAILVPVERIAPGKVML